MGRLNIWWPMYPADFTIDTAHLSNEQVGAYVKLLNAMWRHGGEISCDDEHLSRLLGVSRQKWTHIRKFLNPLFTENAGKWRSDWLSEKLRKAQVNSEKSRQSAYKRWHGHDKEGMQTHSERNANATDEAMRTQCSSSSSSSSSKDLPVREEPSSENASDEINFDAGDVGGGAA